MGKHWLDGYYMFENVKAFIYEVKGESAYWYNLSQLDFPDLPPIHPRGTWKYGEFGEAPQEIQEKTGVKNYNLEMSTNFFGFIFHGVVSEDGTSVTSLDFEGKVHEGHCLSADELKAKLEAREPYKSPKTFYPIQPEKPGKIVWLSGPPGAGKSTTGLLLAKTHDFVYYEADCFTFCVNPYVPLDANEPSMAQHSQTPLKDRPQSTFQICQAAMPEFGKLMGGQEYDATALKKFYQEMAKDILVQKRRIGGLWTVANAVFSREMRDAIREILGEEVIFVTLSLSQEANKKRCEVRHAGEDESVIEAMTKSFTLFEAVQGDEDNAADVVITPEMTKNDVVDNVLKAIQKYL